MIENLIEYVMKNADQCYSDDFPISSIEIWIREFFDRNQMCSFCLNPNNILTKETCCTGCCKLK